MTDVLMHTYQRLPVTFAQGQGAWLTDTEGRRYLDALGGIAVCALGHAHPALTAALSDQAGRLLHVSNLYGIAEQEKLGEALCQLSGMDRVFFANSGAEANEAAIKLARLHDHRRGIQNPAIVVMENSFHGRTLATLSATGNRKVQAGFEPLVQGFVRVPYDDLDALRAVADNQPDVVAVLVEPIQGEGGVRIPSEGYLEGIRALCDEQGWLMMLDEIQTGMGRTGRFFAFQHTDVVPDVMTLAKALGNGVPIGACLARGEAAELFGPGNHGSTFGGNPLACRAGLVVCDTLRTGDLPAHAALLGEKLLDDFASALEDVSGVREIRGRGLMIGIELDHPCGELVGRALEAGLLINVTAETVVRLLPPLILSDAEAEQMVATLSGLIRDFLAQF
ncbi:aspartate aminotransferase family protein [endosymbiont of unidentified scaly snail isolate Monju]|uniref:aspartate aminotransferase family protein n=1 Tax=endosymbiont of unidentified scaly snail isolate Monju TaxID=1248727 RepID=UPI0003891CFE|nr:aspartate aminotransferase family protein [endosymbiont of unidentified scaly snail isolate Monju]BAN68471.1 acetylornithine aminotransferase [endosymbiont of unidentified scaly snail isolate Monju]